MWADRTPKRQRAKLEEAALRELDERLAQIGRAAATALGPEDQPSQAFAARLRDRLMSPRADGLSRTAGRRPRAGDRLPDMRLERLRPSIRWRPGSVLRLTRWGAVAALGSITIVVLTLVEPVPSGSPGSPAGTAAPPTDIPPSPSSSPSPTPIASPSIKAGPKPTPKPRPSSSPKG